jgi:hypothetical protein
LQLSLISGVIFSKGKFAASCISIKNDVILARSADTAELTSSFYVTRIAALSRPRKLTGKWLQMLHRKVPSPQRMRYTLLWYFGGRRNLTHPGERFQIEELDPFQALNWIFWPA